MTDNDLLLLGGAALAAAYFIRNPPLSAVRRQIVDVILPEVVPSTYGDARFSRLAPGYAPDVSTHVTTCGYLPLYVGKQLGYRDGITRGGTNGLRDIAVAAGAWVEAGGWWRRPRPGDFYAIGNASGGIDHVGVIVSTSGSAWTTADAGQGSLEQQQAAYVQRVYDSSAVTLGGPLGPRPLAGWLDIDAYIRSNPL